MVPRGLYTTYVGKLDNLSIILTYLPYYLVAKQNKTSSQSQMRMVLSSEQEAR